MISLSFKENKVEGIKIIDIRVNQRYNMPQNPLEDGTPIIDHKVRLPKEITLNCCVTKGDKAESAVKSIQEMRDAKLDKANTATIVDGIGESHANMVLVDYGNIRNSTEKFDNYYFELKFKEFVTSATTNTATRELEKDNSRMGK